MKLPGKRRKGHQHALQIKITERFPGSENVNVKTWGEVYCNLIIEAELKRDDFDLPFFTTT